MRRKASGHAEHQRRIWEGYAVEPQYDIAVNVAATTTLILSPAETEVEMVVRVTCTGPEDEGAVADTTPERRHKDHLRRLSKNSTRGFRNRNGQDVTTPGPNLSEPSNCRCRTRRRRVREDCRSRNPASSFNFCGVTFQNHPKRETESRRTTLQGTYRVDWPTAADGRAPGRPAD